MAHSVIITTPIPTWDETVERYGLSKADQKFVIRLVDQKISRRTVAAAGKRRAISSKRVQTRAGESAVGARKKANRASATS